MKHFIKISSDKLPLAPAFNSRRAGFTLIELLVAIAIFSSLSSYLVIKYSNNEKSRSLKNQSLEAIAGLEKVQNMALTGETIDSMTPMLYRFSIASCVESCSYKLSVVWANLNEETIIEKALPNVGIATGFAQPLKVDFSPPRGKMLISVEGIPDDDIAFEIANDESAYCIQLNAVSGRIDSVSGACPQSYEINQ